MSYYYLYTITNLLDNKVYVGQSVRPKMRWCQHKWYAKQAKPIQYIHRAMAQYGIQNFVFEIVVVAKTQKDIDESEVILITQYDSRNKNNGYNISPGGDPAWNRGLPREQQPMYGKKQSSYQKQRCADTHKGTTFSHTEKTKLKMSITRKGKRKSESWKQKMSGENHPGSKLTQTIVNKIREEYNAGNFTQKDLSLKYDVTTVTISNIVKLKNWKSS